jgi:hypothetical protein
MERYIPYRFNKTIFFPELHKKKLSQIEVNRDDYLNAVIELEKNYEKNLSDILNSVEISASVKTDRYTLPFQQEIVVIHKATEIINYNFSIYYPAREIVRRLLADDIRKIRFYLLVDVVIDDSYHENLPLGTVVFKFRYWLHY